MKKLIAIIVLAGIGWLIVSFTKPHTNKIKEGNDPMNIFYTIKGERVLLSKGKAEREVVPGSASKEKVMIFGEPVYGDLDKDGDKDAVMFLTVDYGGSGLFYYVVVALLENGKYVGTNAMYLGDRIAPQNINIIDGKAVANFADRMASENFSIQPSVGKSVYVYIDKAKMEIGEAVQNFEGESDKSGIRGNVLLGPTCPVMQDPPDSKCADKPFATKLVLTAVGSTKIIKEFSSDASGKFEIDVPVGTYTISPAKTASVLPRCSELSDIKVISGKYTNTIVSCDTGIR